MFANADSASVLKPLFVARAVKPTNCEWLKTFETASKQTDGIGVGNITRFHFSILCVCVCV